MSSEREQKLELLFEEARGMDPAARDQYLREHCGEDAALRREIQALLDADARSKEFLDRPLLADRAGRVEPTDGDNGDSAYIGRRIGRYTIKQLLGMGGMGAVFEAEQDEPHRSVALKLMRRGLLSPKSMRRFRYESEILGNLHHPHIAQVYDAGVHDDGTGGVPYFVMEHIKHAQPITNYASSNNLSLRERLNLFMKVCDAVHHGHQKGIVHRDLKPANILVDVGGEPKIIDFGVARMTDSDLAVTSQQTDLGLLIGTVQYMSPEQCAGDSQNTDTRSDVYSLGVVLFELLTGEMPYEGSTTTLIHATKTICETEPRRMSAVDRRLRGDLDTIVSKAIEKNPERRYQSAQALAEDVRRFLAHEPIEARPPSRWLKATRLVGRHPLATTTTLCLFIAVVSLAMTTLSVWYLGFQPVQIELRDNRSEVHLLSRAGHVLHRWTSEEPGGIFDAHFVARPDEFGGGAVALISYNWRPANAHQGQMRVYDVAASVQEPLWVGRIDLNDMPDWLIARGFTPDEFRAKIHGVFNVFTDHPGPQIIVSHDHGMYSQSAVRIYDFNGNVLYQAWHEGPISSAYWLQEPQLLVLAGTNGLVFWEHRDHPDASVATGHPHPRVIFAIRPERGVRTTGWINEELEGESTIKPVWYRCVLPPDSSALFQWITLGPPMPRHSSAKRVDVELRLRSNRYANISIVLDEHGREVPGARVISDTYHREPGAPDPMHIFIEDLPPVRSDAPRPWEQATSASER